VENFPGPGEVELVGFGPAGGQFQGVGLVAVAQKEAEVAIHKAPHPEVAPLEDVGQFMGQEAFGQRHSPFHQDHGPPGLGPGPGGDEPGDDVDADGEGRGGGQVAPLFVMKSSRFKVQGNSGGRSPPYRT
jgi:hypothetical protein